MQIVRLLVERQLERVVARVCVLASYRSVIAWPVPKLSHVETRRYHFGEVPVQAVLSQFDRHVLVRIPICGVVMS